MNHSDGENGMFFESSDPGKVGKGLGAISCLHESGALRQPAQLSCCTSAGTEPFEKTMGMPDLRKLA